MQVIHLGPDRWSMIGEGLGTGISQGLTQKLQQMDQQRMERERIEREGRDLTQMMRAMQEAQEPRIEQRHLSPQETRGVQQQAMQRGLLPRMAQMTGEGAGAGLAPGHPGGVPTHLQQAVAPSQQEVMDRFMRQYTPRTETGLSMLQQMMQQQMQPSEMDIRTVDGAVLGVDKGTGRVQELHRVEPQQTTDMVDGEGRRMKNVVIGSKRYRDAVDRGFTDVHDPEEDTHRTMEAMYAARVQEMYPNATPEEVAKLTEEFRSRTQQKDGQSWFVPGEPRPVTSFDGGRTYKDSEGKRKKIPTTGAFPITTQVAMQDLQLHERQQRVAEEMDAEEYVTDPSEIDPDLAAELGTGPLSSLKAGIDAFFGGLGVDKAFGQEGFFPDTIDSRQTLRGLYHRAYGTLQQSQRGAKWDLELLKSYFPDPDTFFKNPASEARKFRDLRNMLHRRKQYNRQVIMRTTDPEMAAELEAENVELGSLVHLLTPKEDKIEPEESAPVDFDRELEKLRRQLGQDERDAREGW